MEKGKSKMFIVFLEGIFFGFLLCLIAVFVYFNAPALNSNSQEISLEQAISRIKNKEVSEINIKESQLTIVDNEEKEFWTSLDSSDATRESILNAADKTGTKVTLEPKSSGVFWIMIINLLPFVILFGMLVFLAVIYHNHIKRKVEK